MSDSSTDTNSDSTDTQTSDQESSTTTSTATRHRFTNDFIAILLVVATVGLAVAYATGHAGVTRLPLPVAGVLSLATLTAVAWAFGPEMLKEAAKARKQTGEE